MKLSSYSIIVIAVVVVVVGPIVVRQIVVIAIAIALRERGSSPGGAPCVVPIEAKTHAMAVEVVGPGAIRSIGINVGDNLADTLVGVAVVAPRDDLDAAALEDVVMAFHEVAQPLEGPGLVPQASKDCESFPIRQLPLPVELHNDRQNALVEGHGETAVLWVATNTVLGKIWLEHTSILLEPTDQASRTRRDPRSDLLLPDPRSDLSGPRSDLLLPTTR